MKKRSVAWQRPVSYAALRTLLFKNNRRRFCFDNYFNRSGHRFCGLYAGIAVGLFVFYFRKQKRASMTAFSDAGGMIRLNLDELTPRYCRTDY